MKTSAGDSAAPPADLTALPNRKKKKKAKERLQETATCRGSAGAADPELHRLQPLFVSSERGRLEGPAVCQVSSSKEEPQRNRRNKKKCYRRHGPDVNWVKLCVANEPQKTFKKNKIKNKNNLRKQRQRNVSAGIPAFVCLLFCNICFFVFFFFRIV